MNLTALRDAGVWLNIGGLQGMIQGCKLAFWYLVISLVVALGIGVAHIVGDMIVEWRGGESYYANYLGYLLFALFGGFVFSGFYLGFGMILGGLPAIVLGGVSGVVIGAVLSLNAIAPYRWNRLAVGGGMAAVIAILVNRAAYPLFTIPNAEWWHYPFFIAMPTVVYLAFCAWLSDRLPLLVEQHRQQSETPVWLPPEWETLDSIRHITAHRMAYHEYSRKLNRGEVMRVGTHAHHLTTSFGSDAVE